MKPTTRFWTVQALLAALFLFAGVTKLVMPADALAAQSHLPAVFMKFIGFCETLGALGLIVPGITKIRTELTPLAAAGLVIIMIGAVIVSVIQGAGAAASDCAAARSLGKTTRHYRRPLIASCRLQPLLPEKNNRPSISAAIEGRRSCRGALVSL